MQHLQCLKLHQKLEPRKGQRRRMQGFWPWVSSVCSRPQLHLLLVPCRALQSPSMPEELSCVCSKLALTSQTGDHAFWFMNLKAG